MHSNVLFNVRDIGSGLDLGQGEREDGNGVCFLTC